MEYFKSFPEQGMFNIDFGGMALRGLRFGFDKSDDLHGEIKTVLIDTFTESELPGGGRRLDGASGGIEISLTVTEESGGVRLSASVTNRSGRDIRLWNINLAASEGVSGHALKLPVPMGDMAYFAYCRKFSANIESFPSVCESDTGALSRMWAGHTVKWVMPYDNICSRDDWYCSQDFGGIYDRLGGRGIFAGFDGPGVAFGDFCVSLLEGSEGVYIRSRMDAILMSPGETRESESAVVLYGKPFDCSREWARLCAKALGARKKYPPLSGYCSWYRLHGRVNEDEIKAATAQYAKLPRKADVIQIDSGYEISQGEWEGNAKFPRGMKAVADDIAAAGMMPGLWLAPLFLHETSSTYKEHPDWVQRLDDGTPSVSFPLWRNGGALFLDPGNPECADFMYETVRKVTADWGYKYLKFDFLYAISVGIRYHDPKLTTFQMLRRSYEIFRQAAGDDVYIMACTGFSARFALGFADAGRIGPDCGSAWSQGTEGALFCAIMRSNVNGIWWWNDPDVYYLRDERLELTFDEKLFFATVTAMTGGMTLSSDLPEFWAPEAMSVYEKIVPPTGKQFYPVDFGNGMPSVLCVNSRTSPEGALIAFAAALHWDEGGDVTIDFAALGLENNTPYHVYDFWNEKHVGIHTGKYICPRGAPHSINLFVIRPADAGTPTLVGDTTHVISSAESRDKDGILSIAWECFAHKCQSDETFTIYSPKKPEPFDMENCSLNKVEKSGDSVWKIHLTASTGKCKFKGRCI